MGAKDGVVSVVINPEAAPKMAGDVAAFLTELETKIARGELDPLAGR
jgi:hypothetical protein